MSSISFVLITTIGLTGCEKPSFKRDYKEDLREGLSTIESKTM